MIGQAIDSPAGMDPRFEHSRVAVKTCLSMMYDRWPRRVAEIEARFESYVEVMCGTQPRQKPMLNKDEIQQIFGEILREWSAMTFPEPGHFKVLSDRLQSQRRQTPNSSAISGERLTHAQEAYNAGKMYRQWSYVYERYPEKDRYYAATRPNGETIFRDNGKALMIDRWGNAEHFRRAYDDAMRQLTGDPEAQRSVEELVAKVQPRDPPREPLKPVRGFRTLGQPLTPKHVPGGPGQAAADKIKRLEQFEAENAAANAEREKERAARQAEKKKQKEKTP